MLIVSVRFERAPASPVAAFLDARICTRAIRSKVQDYIVTFRQDPTRPPGRRWFETPAALFQLPSR